MKRHWHEMAEWRGIDIQAIKSQNFHMPNGNRVPENSNLASSFLNLYRFQRITQSRQPRQTPNCFLYYSTSSLLSFHPRRIQIYYSQIRTTRPAHQRSSHTKGTYQIITCSISSAHTALVPARSAPSNIVEIFSSCTTFALSSLPLSHSFATTSALPSPQHLTQELTICSDNKFYAPRNCRHG